jgi:hypothetical protein
MSRAAHARAWRIGKWAVVRKEIEALKLTLRLDVEIKALGVRAGKRRREARGFLGGAAAFERDHQ